MMHVAGLWSFVASKPLAASLAGVLDASLRGAAVASLAGGLVVCLTGVLVVCLMGGLMPAALVVVVAVLAALYAEPNPRHRLNRVRSDVTAVLGAFWSTGESSSAALP